MSTPQTTKARPEPGPTSTPTCVGNEHHTRTSNGTPPHAWGPERCGDDPNTPSPIEWLTPPRVDGYGRITYGRWGGYLIEVLPMMYGERLVLTPESCPQTYDYGWCYGRGAALIAARAWDPETQAEPAWYVKAVQIIGEPRRPGQRAREGVRW